MKPGQAQSRPAGRGPAISGKSGLQGRTDADRRGFQEIRPCRMCFKAFGIPRPTREPPPLRSCGRGGGGRRYSGPQRLPRTPPRGGGGHHPDDRSSVAEGAENTWPATQQRGGPANQQRITISELRRRNTKEGHMTKPSGTPRGQDGHPVNLPAARQNCRDALKRNQTGQPLQMTLLLLYKAMHSAGYH